MAPAMVKRTTFGLIVVLALALSVSPSAQGTFWVLVNGVLHYTGSIVVTGTATTQVVDKGGEVYNVKAYGATGDGATDDSTAVAAAITAATNANGGTIYFPAGTYLISGQITFPNDAASPAPHQKSLRLLGTGAHFSGIAAAVNGGSVLNLTYAGTIGKMVSYGLGQLTIENLTLKNTGSDSLPFVYVTNTTLLARRSTFIGASAASPKQDAIVLGGQGAAVNGSSTGYFQGYGTLIDANYFDYINRGVLLQVNANAVQITNNVWWADCAGTAAIEDWNDTSYQNAGLFTSGNLIEMNGYTYGIHLYRTLGATLVGDSFYDGGSFTSYYNFNSIANALPNYVIPGYFATATKLSSGAGSPAFYVSAAAGISTSTNGTNLVDSTGAFTNSQLRVGRIELISNRFVVRNGSTFDDVFNLYNNTGHSVKMFASQSDGFLGLGDSGANTVFQVTASDGTMTFKNTKASTGYTLMEVQPGAGQSTIDMMRVRDSGSTIQAKFKSDASLVLSLPLDTTGFKNNGVLAVSSTAPTVTSAGSSPSVTASNGSAAFRVNVGTGGTATTIVMAMPTATTGWSCTAVNITGAAANRADSAMVEQSSTTTAVTLQYQTVSTGVAKAFTASDIVDVHCLAF